MRDKCPLDRTMQEALGQSLTTLSVCSYMIMNFVLKKIYEIPVMTQTCKPFERPNYL